LPREQQVVAPGDGRKMNKQAAFDPRFERGHGEIPSRRGNAKIAGTLADVARMADTLALCVSS